MFTGIVEEIGVVKGIKNSERSSSLLIKAKTVLEKTRLGDSICTNGICLTVTNLSEDTFTVDVMPETLRRSSLGELNIGSKVNLERAMILQSRFGGHVVSGHIDGIGKISSFMREDNAIWITIKTSINILKYVVEKGSIAIDGISLTVAYVDKECFKVSIIPHTAEKTTLITKNIGDTVNLECDVIGKYVEKLLKFDLDISNVNKSPISEDFLRDNGFM
ncbi:riboflavin synthase [Hathewaya histolytica]|uniref:Riboflavin synthase n=1 Tax=Hathewaya histolytica TaxID=1498 RepID=A0A4U9RW73_HATHI|nr:riboflavin synthase [Hathewaya histolytica]VTQ95936.1 riboflavin synthase, alpha subunit [Hathewaya histolytica]